MAALSAAPATAGMPLAALSFELGDSQDGWYQLLPAGHFAAWDGRPRDVPGGKWYLDGKAAGRMIAAAQALITDLVIDYEHQTLRTDENGKEAPAAGWFSAQRGEIEWREGSGLWIKPRWTQRAQGYIAGKEYRYLSAVFTYDKETGTPLALHSAALVNRPGLDGLQPLAPLKAHSNPQQETVMNKHLRTLLAKLGIEIADNAEITDEQGTAALSALDALKVKADSAEAAETELAALKGKSPAEGVDLAKYVPVDTYNALVTEMAALKHSTEEQTAEQLLADARKDGKVLAAEEEYLTRFARQQGVAALKGLLDARPAVAALKGQQTPGGDGKQKQGDADELTAEDMAVLKATGLDKDAYLAARRQLS